MKVTFISQASMIVETEDCVIWSDPWLFGKAFNDSWALFPEPNFSEDWYGKITHLWISHEHPDHFNIPTLKSLPKDFKESVTVLFQKNNSDKMPKAFKMLGFKKVTLLKNRKVTSISDKTKVHNCQVGQMDSSLAIISEGKTLLNVNDCEINSVDCKNYLKDLGKVDGVFNQFSMAGYNGQIDYDIHLPKSAEQILNNMVANHRDLKASFSIPFASNIYFCCEDNKHINLYANTPTDVENKFKNENLDCCILYPGETVDVDNYKKHDNTSSLESFKKLYSKKDSLIYDSPEKVEIDLIKEAFTERFIQLNSKFSKIVLKKLKPVIVYIPDLNKKVRLSLYSGIFEIIEDNNKDNFDLQINSQPLFFSFKFTWGLQTLGVSARYFIKNNHTTWRWYRIITSLNNAELYLKPKYILSKSNLNFMKDRLGGSINQLVYRLKIMKQ